MKSRSRALLTVLTLLLTAFGLAGLPSASLASAQAGPAGPGATAAQDVVAAMQPGWNLGNTLDATGDDETSWGNPRVEPELLSAIKEEGFNSVRIPVTWGQHQGSGPDYTIDPAYLERVQEVVGWAVDEGLYVLINVHHDSWQWVMDLPTRHDEVLARYTATWEQIADAFRDAPDLLLFESINEPFFEGSSGEAQDAELLHELNSVFHTLVRDSGGGNADRLLVLPTLHTSSDQPRLDELAETFEELDDPHLAATVHYYGFWPFSVNVAGYTRFDAETEADLTGAFDRVHETFVARGIPVILGEYGLLGFDRHTGTVQQGEKLKFFEAFGAEAREHQVTTMLWDNGQHLGRTSFEWSDPALFAQVASSWDGRSGTASTDQVYVERGAEPAPATVELNLNGTSLTSLAHGSEQLVDGVDYTLAGDQLTLAAGTLDRLTESQEYGVNAVLTLEFSAGVDWDLRVIVHEAPSLDAVAGTTEGLAVPATFRGDQLATMEAVYADGGNAGPHDWTSYKEFGAAFEPDYDAGSINLTSDFFAEVDDGATVELTFHFWSGETVAYTLVRSGGQVTGSPA